MIHTRPVTLVYRDIGYSGGVERVFAEILKYLAQQGYEVNAICARVDPALEPLCTRVHHIPDVQKRGRLQGTVAQLSWMRQCTAMIRKERAALGVVLAAPGSSWEADVAMAGSCHLAGLLARSSGGYLGWVANPLNLLAISSEFLPYHGSVQRVMTPSSRTKNEIATLYRVAGNRIRVIPHGVDQDRFRPAPERKAYWRSHFDIPQDAFVPLTVTNEVKRKGCFEVLEALRMLAAQGHDIAYVVAGRDDYTGLLRAAERAGVAARLRVLPAQSGEQLVGLYQMCDAFVLPTGYESFGLVCMEAMACGVPAVVTRVGGIEDYVCEGASGLFVDRTGAGIAVALRRLLLESSFRAKLGAGAYAAASRYSWKSVLSALDGMLQEVQLPAGCGN